MQTISSRAIALAGTLLSGLEGFRPKPYQDGKGVWTIGYGSTALADGSPVTSTTPPITQAAAAALRDRVLQQLAAKLGQMVTLPLQDCQAAALLSFQYNVGSGALRGSKLLKILNSGDILGAADQFEDWIYVTINHRLVKSKGLMTRRATERSVFLGNQTVKPPGVMPTTTISETDALNDAQIAKDV
jgi:lysozyme